MGKKSKKIDFNIIEMRENIWRTQKNIVGLNPLPDVCPKCSGNLFSSYSLIPIGDGKSAKVPGKECRRCGCLYVANSTPVHRILRDNLLAKDFSLDGEHLWNYSTLKKNAALREKRLKKLTAKQEILSHFASGIMLVTLTCEEKKTDYVITTAAIPQESGPVLSIHYSEALAREILTAIFHPERHRKCRFNNRVYDVTFVCYPKGKPEHFPEHLMPSDVKIKPGGGYPLQIKNNRSEIVDLLVFAPYTKRYEIIRATYDTDTKQCYMDISIFRAFVKKLGKPAIRPTFESKSRYKLSFDDLRTESILRVYGYTTSSAENLSTAERQTLLAEIVDLELLTVPYIVRLLEFFCSTHASDKDIHARNKWQHDMKFIKNYRVNPARFLIVKPSTKG